MTALIVGAAGFVGTYLIEALMSEGDSVYATKLSGECIDVPNVFVRDLDICDYAAVCRMMEEVRPDVVYHLAAQSSVKLSWEKPQLTMNINVIGAVNLFEAVRNIVPSSRVVVIGSSEEYGSIDYKKAVKEATYPRPGNVYALSKFTQEELARIYGKAYGLHFVMTRSFNHVGPRQGKGFVLSDFCSQVAEIERGEREAVIKVGNLSALRDFSDVRDVVRAYRLLALHGADGEIYNVGSGKVVSVSDLLSIVLSMSERKIEVQIDRKKFRPIDVPVIRADITKISELGWTAEIPLQKSVADTLHFFRGCSFR